VGGGSHRNYFKLDGTGGETDLGRGCSRVEPRGPHNTKKKSIRSKKLLSSQYIFEKTIHPVSFKNYLCTIFSSVKTIKTFSQ
jgi:hypothetical protein